MGTVVRWFTQWHERRVWRAVYRMLHTMLHCPICHTRRIQYRGSRNSVWQFVEHYYTCVHGHGFVIAVDLGG